MRFVIAAMIIGLAFLFARMVGRGLTAGVVAKLEGGVVERHMSPALFWSTILAHAAIALELIVLADAALLGRFAGVAGAALALLR
jgi:hypothetical protein